MLDGKPHDICQAPPPSLKVVLGVLNILKRGVGGAQRRLEGLDIPDGP
jgi:hypothetical protein